MDNFSLDCLAIAYRHIIGLIDYISNYSIVKYYTFTDTKVNIITIGIINKAIKVF
jgi:hypothetical protein